MMDVINMNEMLLMDVKNKTADSPTNNSFKQLSFNDFISVVFIYYFFYSKKSRISTRAQTQMGFAHLSAQSREAGLRSALPDPFGIWRPLPEGQRVEVVKPPNSKKYFARLSLLFNSK